ncbi:MAG TPA: hypothetical protein VI756_27420, partial [Blastocatellia bacterium]
VSPGGQAPAPTIVGPLPVGAVFVQLSNLIPGAQIEIFLGGVSLGTGTCFDAVQYFSVPPLTHKKSVQATQQLCSSTSALSNPVSVESGVPALDRPAVEPSLFQCAPIIQVSNLTVGALVYVYSKLLGAPIGIAQVTAQQMQVQVAPLLVAGDQIYARQMISGKTSKPSKSVTVQELPNQGSPAIVSPVEAGSSSVFVQNVVPGARVDVYVDELFRGTATAVQSTVQVQLSGAPLNVGDQVTARETTCEGMQTSMPVTVGGCQCTQTSKVPTQPPGNFLYTFNCMTPMGTVVVVQVVATNDTAALQAAENNCDSAYGD